MRRNLHIDALHRMVAKALAAGATRPNMSRVRWDISGPCQRPHVTEFYSRPAGDEGQRMIHNRRQRIVVKRFSMAPMTLELHTPCRKCGPCKAYRQRLWTARAYDETRLSARTWFGTLTISPEAWVHAISRCRAAEASQGVDFDALPETERHALLHAQFGAEVTKMLKRIRGLVPAEHLRFLVVLELTQNGVIHYHLLLHERSSMFPVRHAQLKDQWPFGFSKWKLVDDARQASYVAKYLSKTLLARVRASEGYGTGTAPKNTLLSIGEAKSNERGFDVKNPPPSFSSTE